jgi:hypothetical protein
MIQSTNNEILSTKAVIKFGNMNDAFYLIILLIILSGCTGDERKTVSLLACIDCHSIHTDTNHQQPCISCHKGNNQAQDRDDAHLGFVPSPAHPDHLVESCGSCHADITGRITDSLHFTLRNSTNLFRKAFGAENELASFLDTPKDNDPESVLELADDLLRRRCFRCHPYNSGDAYPAVSHGTGCASCHMAFTEGKTESHSFQRPGDAQCLACHYGNYVGFDYYGRFEHDFNYEYRTPFTTKNKYFRPYGLEYHQLKPDIHQIRGLLCIDCHKGEELMKKGGKKPSCEKCHSSKELQRSLPAEVENRQGLFILHGRDGKDHTIPLMQHPAHEGQTENITCQACHAQWTFSDFGKHFLRSDTDDFTAWANLSVQGSFELETILDNNNDFDKPELPAQMTDKLTGEPEIGLWHKGLTMRRWESPILGRDDKGRITTMRPLLDYFLSWMDEEENVRFDSVQSQAPDMGMRPYVPHTTGPAGFFYKEHIEQFLAKERSAAADSITPRQNNATQ